MKMIRPLVYLCAIFAMNQVVLIDSYKILCAFPSFSQSHVIVASGILRGLAELGHEVTMLGTYQLPEPVENYRDIVVPLMEPPFDHQAMLLNQGVSHWTKLKSFKKFIKYIFDLSNSSLYVPEFRKIIEEETFDLVIAGIVPNQFLYGLAAHFKCPLIVLFQIQTISFTNFLVGNPSSVASVPNPLTGLTGHMNFKERVINFGTFVCETLLTRIVNYFEGQYYEANFPSDKYPTFEEMQKNVSLVFVNHHFSQGVPQAYVPAMIEIGGAHVKTKPSPLPEKIQQWLDGADDGAIYFSFGSIIKSSKLSPDIIDTILNTFSKLKQRVLFKWESDNFTNKPDNVMVGKWLPQEDILAHKNVKIFITHGGKGSLLESQFQSVPVIAIPIINDQMTNVDIAVKEGWAVKIEFTNLTEATLLAAIDEMLTNPIYRETVQKIALLYKDRPMTALETVNYWVEYVIRHRGAPHLQSPAVHLNFFQFHSLDVIAFISLIFYVSLKTFIICTKFLCRKICKKSRSKAKRE